MKLYESYNKKGQELYKGLNSYFVLLYAEEKGRN